MKRQRILIATAQVPFTEGGAELLVNQLKAALIERGFEADVVQIPFAAQPKESLIKQVGLWRALDLRSFNGMDVDLVIALKFPAYMTTHPRKVVWLIHQYRQLYDLYNTRFGDLSEAADDESLRQMLLQADDAALREVSAIYTISDNVKSRLFRYLGIEATTLTPPLPYAGRYFSREFNDYILSVGRICSIKRVDLIVKAMAEIDDRLKLKIVGSADESEIGSYLNSELDKHHLRHRVEFLGKVTTDQLLSLYAHAFAVYYAPFDEDLGFVTLEALASGRPVITTNDSGGVLEFVEHEKNGLVTEPNPGAIASAVNRLLSDADFHRHLGAAADAEGLTNSWDQIVATLTSALP